jgi:large subunit ribosomal protein L30
VAGRLRVTQVKSTISHIARNRATVRALGLHRIGDTVEIPDNDATRGMVRQVRFLVRVEEVDAPQAVESRPARTHAASSEPPPEPAPRRSATRASARAAKETE